MSRALAHLFPLLVVLGGHGCIIGTWPTPESKPKTSTRDGTPIAEETCDSLDDDADGSIDEGCTCSGDVRGCVAAQAGRCGFGLQRCLDGTWQECSDLGPPFTTARTPQVRVNSVDPAAITRGSPEPIVVVIEPIPACDGIQVPSVSVTLASRAPVMRVKAIALDNGLAPDVAPGDRLFSAALVNAFGPGVAAQTLELRASAILSGAHKTATAFVELEEP